MEFSDRDIEDAKQIAVSKLKCAQEATSIKNARADLAIFREFAQKAGRGLDTFRTLAGEPATEEVLKQIERIVLERNVKQALESAQEAIFITIARMDLEEFHQCRQELGLELDAFRTRAGEPVTEKVLVQIERKALERNAKEVLESAQKAKSIATTRKLLGEFNQHRQEAVLELGAFRTIAGEPVTEGTLKLIERETLICNANEALRLAQEATSIEAARKSLKEFNQCRQEAGLELDAFKTMTGETVTEGIADQVERGVYKRKAEQELLCAQTANFLMHVRDHLREFQTYRQQAGQALDAFKTKAGEPVTEEWLKKLENGPKVDPAYSGRAHRYQYPSPAGLK